MIKVLRSALLILLSTFISTCLFAQMIQDPTTWTIEAKKKSGDKYDLVIHLKLKKDWHIWSLQPGGDGGQLPPSVNFDKNENIILNGALKEKGKLISRSFDGVDGITHLFIDKVDYYQSATIKTNTKISGSYSYMVCDEHQCLPPKTKSFSIEVKDAGGKTTNDNTDTATLAATNNTPAAIDTANKNVSDIVAADASTAKTQPANTKTNAVVAKPKQMSLLVLFLISLGGGIAALITPCVYSMIPITVSFFTKRSKTRQEGIKNAFFYALSIILIFTILGVIISIIFGPKALYKLSTNWIANLFFFAMFVVFGISFLGAFEIALPSSWTSKTDSKAGIGSFSGIFFMALTLVIVSFSCTGPIIGPLVVVAGNGGIIGPAIGMFGFSLGLALPFALFAVFPGLLNKMATSGGWLNQVKVTLGFIELGFALKFFSNADLVMHWRLLDREIFIAIWIVLAILVGVYLLGKLKLTHDDTNPKNVYGQEYVSIFKLFLAIISFTFAVYLLPGMWGAPLKGLGQFIPPVGTQDFVLGEENSKGDTDPGVTAKGEKGQYPQKYASEMKIYEPTAVRKLGLVTYFDYEEALAVAAKLKKPLMIDFTGITCVNCRKMESQVWSSPEVLKRLKNDFIVVSLFCDAEQVPLLKQDQYISNETKSLVTTLGDKNLDLQVSKFKANSQPFYFYVDEKGNKLADEGYSYDPDVTKFVNHLDNVSAAYKKSHP